MSDSGGDLREDRYSRFRLIPWWDQSKISNCRLLVVGAGALGNEILKNAALLGFSQVVIVDLDRIEEGNLSRTYLFKDPNVLAKHAVIEITGARVQLRAAGLVYWAGQPVQSRVLQDGDM